MIPSRLQTPRVTLALVAVGLPALILGYLGYQAIDVEDPSPADALYASLQLFFLDYNGPPTDPPWQLQIARFSAAVFSVLTVLVLLATVAREQMQRLRIRVWNRRHVLLLGLGERGRRVAARYTSKRPLAVIEKDASNGHVQSLRASGIPVLLGDARHAHVLETAKIARAAHVLVAAGDDSTALEILAACQRAFTNVRRPQTTIHVALDDIALWRELHQISLARAQQPVRTEFISVPDRIAETLVSSAEQVPSPAGHDRLLVHGAGPICVRAAAHAIRRSVLAGNSVSVTFVGPQAGDVDGRLKALEPWVEDVAEVGIERRTLLRLGGHEPTAAFVCGLTEAESLAAAASLSHQLPSTTPIYVSVPDRDTEQALAATELRLAQIQLIPTEAEALGDRLLDQSALELIARAKHDDYRLQETGRGIDASVNPSVVPWEELPESLRESNRRFAESVGEKLAALGATLHALSGPVGETAMPISAALLDEMAEREHERWVSDLLADGWQHTDGPKDPERKVHPLLVPWEELDEAEREKDREAILALPMALATVGYKIAIPEQGAQAPETPEAIAAR